MEYTVNKLSKLAGITPRTLRYYDTLGLLSPARISSSGYRIYGQKEVVRLQQILFYRELGVSLDEIMKIITSKAFDEQTALESHLTQLLAKREQLDLLIDNVEKSLKSSKGEYVMSDKEKFEGFKQKLVDDNEKQYGAEVRAAYGEDAINRSNAKIKGMTKEEYQALEALTLELNEAIKSAFEQGDPAGDLAQKACALHKKWLTFYWNDYSKEAHLGLTQMYVDDPRFTAYYDKIAVGSAVFLRNAMQIFLA